MRTIKLLLSDEEFADIQRIVEARKRLSLTPEIECTGMVLEGIREWKRENRATGKDCLQVNSK